MRYKHFSKDERNELSVLLNKGYSIRVIAQTLERSPSSVSREIKHNTTKGPYSPRKAQQRAYLRRYRAKRQSMKILGMPWLEKYIQEKLVLKWTPEQIAGRLKLENNNVAVISSKSIYNWLGTVWGQNYVKYLPYKKPYRRKRKVKSERTIIKNRVFIEQRPDIVNQRLRVGDFEGDTLGVPRLSLSTIAGVVDRKSRYFLIKKILRLKETMAAFQNMLSLSNSLSLTLDNGPENAKYEQLNIPVFFCHPRSAWEKPSIENSFQRLRMHKDIPKKTRVDNYTNEQLSAIVDRMNNTPRKCLGFRTPREVFFQETTQFSIPFLLTECCTSG